MPADVWVDAANGLNLRAEAKADAKVVTTLKNKQHLVAIGTALGPDAGGITWQNVRTDDGQTGWVSAQFLTKTNHASPTLVPTKAAPAASTGEAWVSAVDGFNLRAQAAVSSTLVALLRFGTHLTLTGAPTGPDAGGITWQNVRTDDGKTGFVSAQYISPNKPATSTPTVTAPVTATAPVTPTATIIATIPATTRHRMKLDPESLKQLSPAEKRALLARLLEEREQRPQDLPLSHGQRALWVLQQFAPRSAAYNVSLAARIRSPLDTEALRRAFQFLTDRHAVLRATFPGRDGDPVMRLRDRQPVSFAVADATAWSDAALHTRLTEDAHEPFDLGAGPVLRVRL